LQSIKGDFIPELCRRQFSKYRIQQCDEYEDKSAQKKTILDYVYNDAKLADSVKQSNKRDDLLGCYVYIQTDGICLRANNTAIYAEANRQVKQIKRVLSSFISLIFLQVRWQADAVFREKRAYRIREQI
jgi:hypothetical protein